MPSFRHSSVVFAPASACCSAAIICSSVCAFRAIPSSCPRAQREAKWPQITPLLLGSVFGFWVSFRTGPPHSSRRRSKYPSQETFLHSVGLNAGNPRRSRRSPREQQFLYRPPDNRLVYPGEIRRVFPLSPTKSPLRTDQLVHEPFPLIRLRRCPSETRGNSRYGNCFPPDLPPRSVPLLLFSVPLKPHKRRN